MKSDTLFFIELLISFLPFILFAFLNAKANVKKENRNRQYAMPVIAVIYSVILLVFLNKISSLCTKIFLWVADLFDKIHISVIAHIIDLQGIA